MRLLVVEDETRLAELLARGLQEEGYAVDVAGRGEDALWMASHPKSHMRHGYPKSHSHPTRRVFSAAPRA